VDTDVLGRNIVQSVLGGKLETVCYVERLTHTHQTERRTRGRKGTRERGSKKGKIHDKPWSEIFIYLTLLKASKNW
jgi:hypothetical protein